MAELELFLSSCSLRSAMPLDTGLIRQQAGHTQEHLLNQWENLDASSSLPLFSFGGRWVGRIAPFSKVTSKNVITGNASGHTIPSPRYIKKWLCIPPGCVASRHWCAISRCFLWHVALQLGAWIHRFFFSDGTQEMYQRRHWGRVIKSQKASKALLRIKAARSGFFSRLQQTFPREKYYLNPQFPHIDRTVRLPLFSSRTMYLKISLRSFLSRQKCQPDGLILAAARWLLIQNDELKGQNIPSEHLNL